jgi:glycosyltransferase involved in cell wall biosynthesis
VIDAKESAFKVMVLAHNEAEQIQSCLDSIRSAAPDRKVIAYVMANGCTDNTEEVVRDYSTKNGGVVLVSIAMPDKCNAWNVFVHDTLAPSADDQIYFFMDGDARASPGAFTAMAAMLVKDPIAMAVGAVPGSGRSMEADRRQMLEERHLVANLYALRGSFVRRLQELGTRLPLGLEGDDGLIGALVKWNLNPHGDWVDQRIAVCAEARFTFQSLSWTRSRDWRTYFKRIMRYARRPYEFELIRNQLKAHGIKGMPSSIKEAYKHSAASKFRWRGLYSVHSWLALRMIQKHAK